MAITEYNYIPEYTRLGVNNKPKDVITASYWNGLFNALSHQGDHTAEELGNILNHFSTALAGIENEIAESAEDIANIHGVFRINVTYSNGVYTADKTFNEIKAAYDAGQLPYVVSGSNTIYTLTDCYLATEQMAMDFKRYLIGDDTLEDNTLRIYSYTTSNGSNIVHQNTEFNIPIKVLEVILTTQNSVTVADKTFAQVETAVEDGIPVLKVHSDGDISWFFLLDKSPTEIDFIGFVDEQLIAYLTAKQDGTWETTVAARVTAEMLSSLNDKIGNIGQLTTTDKTSLVAAVNEIKEAADGKQDKLIAGDNITIAEDGKTISAAGKANVLGYFRTTFTGQSVEDFTLGKTFAQVKEEIANNNKIMLVDNFDYDCVYIMTYNGSSTVVFTGMVEDAGAWVIFSVTSDDKWQLDIQSRVTFDNHLELSNRVGATFNLTTTDKSNLVAAVNEVKQTTDTKQDKLIAGANITIAADGKTISATGGGGSTIELDTTLSETGKAADAKAVGDALSDKQDTISDLVNIRSGAAKGATALQSVPSTYRTASAQDVVDNGLNERISAIEGKEAGWDGKYVKPTNGIPKTDLANGVQASLGKAETALQEHQSLAAYRTAAAQDNIDITKQDKLIAGENITIAEDGKTISATGGGVLPVTLTLGAPIQQSNCIGWYYTADKGRYEIKDAIDAGITVLKCSLIYEDNPNEVADVIYLNFSSMDSTAVFVGFDLPSKYYELRFPITSSIEGMFSYITLPTKTSELENDAGYLTLATLPKYEGVVE